MSDDHDELERMAVRVARVTGAHAARPGPRVQALWSGYGEIRRFWLEGSAAASAVVKRVAPPSVARHSRGWNTRLAHERKLRSYEVEQAWYARYAPRLGGGCRLPVSHLLERSDHGWLFVLEDLDDAGFGGRREHCSEGELRACLDWLACLHAELLGTPPDGLWEEGTYWHLATRPDELRVMQDDVLREAAPVLDARLREARFRTVVHGDAKVANFCFGQDAVAAVDFQYAGGGVGVKDVAYFFSSVLDADECERRCPALLDHYFASLQRALESTQPQVDGGAVEAEWRALYPVAWADFTRFLLGWAPEHAKLHHYSLRLTREALQQL